MQLIGGVIGIQYPTATLLSMRQVPRADHAWAKPGTRTDWKDQLAAIVCDRRCLTVIESVTTVARLHRLFKFESPP